MNAPFKSLGISVSLITAILSADYSRADAVAAPEVVLVPFEGAHGIFNRTVSPTGLSNPVLLRLTIKPSSGQATRADVTLTAEDIFGKPVDWKQQLAIDVPAGGKPVERYVPLSAGPGYFSIQVTVQIDGVTASAGTDLGIVPPPHPGLRPDSLFASNTSEMKHGADLALLAAIGMKVERTHFLPPIATKDKDWAKHLPPGEPPPLNYTPQDKLWAETRAAGLWAMPVIGYALPGDVRDLALRLGMYGPPADYERFANTYVQVLKHYPELTTFEFWNEPWVFGWNFAGTPSDYRRLQKLTLEKLLRLNPNYRFLAGNSTMYVADNIEPEPSSWKGLLQGISHHPYADTGAVNYRSGVNLRSIDEAGRIARRMGLRYAYLTEGGTSFSSPPPAGLADLQRQMKSVREKMKAFVTREQHQSEEFRTLAAEVGWLQGLIDRFPISTNNYQNASKIVQYYVRAALAGMFAGNAQWQIGYGPGWTRSNTTFAVMTHFLEDRPPVADIWPGNELIWGGIFANPKFVTDQVRALPRAGELSVRWSVPIPNDRADDTTKVAVLWSLTGKSSDELDAGATLTIRNAGGLSAYDMTGRRIRPSPGGLKVPFGEAPVYITTDSLSVLELRDRIASATIEQVTAVNVYAFSLTQDATQQQDLSVRVENQVNRKVAGRLKLAIDGMPNETSSPFEMDAGKLAEVKVAWPGAKASAVNQYPVTITAEIDPAGDIKPSSVARRQIVAAARFVKRTIDVNGSLDQWQGVTPVLLDSKLLDNKVDLTQYFLDPHLDKPTGDDNDKRIVARVYTAYDDANVYLAAAIQEDGLNCPAGAQVVKGRLQAKVNLPYRTGTPDGLNYVTLLGDVFQFSFGFRDRVPGQGRQMDDLWAWKGCFYDTDYSYVAHQSTDGDRLVRIWGADTSRRNGYQTEAVPGIGPVDGAKVKITREEDKKRSIYQLAIPRTELKLFNPADGRCRFGFVICNDEHLGTAGLGWSEAAGVFDHWTSFGSFPPTWSNHAACQTFFGIDR